MQIMRVKEYSIFAAITLGTLSLIGLVGYAGYEARYIDNAGKRAEKSVGELRASRVEYVLGAASGMELTREGQAKIQRLEAIRANLRYQWRYDDVYQKGLSDARSNNINEHGVVRIANALLRMNPDLKDLAKRAIPLFKNAGYDDKTARRMARASIVLGVYAPEAAESPDPLEWFRINLNREKRFRLERGQDIKNVSQAMKKVMLESSDIIKLSEPFPNDIKELVSMRAKKVTDLSFGENMKEVGS